MKKRRFATAIAYALLLLFAQQSAFMHAAWHAGEQVPAHQKKQGDASFHGKLCGLHGAFGQVLGGMQSAPAQAALFEPLAQAIEYRPCALVVLELRVPLSRGPPASLLI